MFRGHKSRDQRPMRGLLLAVLQWTMSRTQVPEFELDGMDLLTTAGKPAYDDIRHAISADRMGRHPTGIHPIKLIHRKMNIRP